MPLRRKPRTAEADARRARVRGALALGRETLRRTSGGRLGRTLALALACGFALIAVVLRVADGASAPLHGLALSAARLTPWLAGLPVALAAAHGRAEADRAAGVESLAATRGIAPADLGAVRALAAMAQTAKLVGAPLVALAALTALTAGSLAGVARGLALALVLSAFAVIVGITLGGVAAACSRAGADRGRALFLSVIIVPWLLAGALGFPAWSIPGALEAALLSMTGGAGG